MRAAVPRLRDRFVPAVLLAAALAPLFFLQSFFRPVALQAQQAVPTSVPAIDARRIEARFAWMPLPDAVASEFMTTPQPLTPEQRQMSTLDVDRLSSTWAGRRAAAITADASVGPPAGSEVVPRDGASATAPDGSDPVRLRVSPLTPSGVGLAVRMIAEPAVAIGDSVAWVTGNWFAARSIDAGVNWSYVNPYADFPTFTSDQDATYDSRRGLFLWHRQGGTVPGRLENSFKLNVSADGALSWCSYTLRPSDVDPTWNVNTFDYPHLALSDNFLYVSSMLMVTGAGFASPRMVLLRLPLDGLAECSTFRYAFWTSDEGWSWTPVENGASSIMYLGDTLDAGSAQTGTFRVYAQPEETTTLFFVDRSVPAWTFTERTALCTVAGGGNPCARTDQRITSGWVRQSRGGGEIGFMWNVREGGGFPYPYIDAVTFDEPTLTVTGRPVLWDRKCAWQYGAAAPNGNDLGIAAFYFCPSQPPAHAVGVADQGKWSMVLSRAGDVPTSTLVWGDYIRVRADGRGYLATGYTIGASGAEPFVASFGRRQLLSNRPDLFDQNPQH